MLFRIAEESAVQSRTQVSPGRLGHPLSGLRAVVLLAGSVRANQLRKATGRCALEMPVGNNRSVLDCWREQLVTMAEQLGIDNLPVRVMVDQASGMTPGVSRHGPVQLSIEIDPGEFRGTGGLLSDVAREYRDDDLILATHASQLLFEPLAGLAEAMAEVEADVSMVCSAEGTPSGLMLLRCGCLRDINPVGFVDLNEQALPAIARRTTCGWCDTTGRRRARCGRCRRTSKRCVSFTAARPRAGGACWTSRPRTGKKLLGSSNRGRRSTRRRSSTTRWCCRARGSAPTRCWCAAWSARGS